MTCKELKDNILNGKLAFDCMFFVYQDTPFVPLQYAEAIAKTRGLSIAYVDSLSGMPEPDAFDTDDGNLYVLVTEEIKKIEKPRKNAIIICKKTNDERAIEFPKTEAWQVIDYMKARCPGLNDDEISWLYDICKKDIYRIDNELRKIEAFPASQQDAVFDKLTLEGNYADLNQTTVFDFTNAILRNDLVSLARLLKEIGSLDIDAIGLSTILKNGVKNVIDIQFNKDATAESVGMKENQFRAVKYYNVGKFRNDRLIGMYEFLTSIDCRLKSGELQLDNAGLIDYMICNVMIG